MRTNRFVAPAFLCSALVVASCGSTRTASTRPDERAQVSDPADDQRPAADERAQVSDRADDQRPAAAPSTRPRTWTVNLQAANPPHPPESKLAVKIRTFSQLPSNVRAFVAPAHSDRLFAFVRPIGQVDAQASDVTRSKPRIKVLEDRETTRTLVLFEPSFIERGCSNHPAMEYSSDYPRQVLLPKSNLPLLIVRTRTDVPCGFKNTPETALKWRIPATPSWTHVTGSGIRTFNTLSETKSASTYNAGPLPQGLESIDFETKTLVIQGHPERVAQFYAIDPVEPDPSVLIERNVVRFDAPFERASCYTLNTTGKKFKKPVAHSVADMDCPPFSHCGSGNVTSKNPSQIAYHWTSPFPTPKWDVFVLPRDADFAIATKSETRTETPAVCKRHMKPIFLRSKQAASRHVKKEQLDYVDFKKEMLVAFGFAGDTRRNISPTKLVRKKRRLVVPVPVSLQMAYCCPAGRMCSTAPGIDQVRSSSANWRDPLSQAHRAPRSAGAVKVQFTAQTTSNCSAARNRESPFHNQKNPMGGPGRPVPISP